MLALLLAIAATAGWIIFDVAISIVTYPVMPTREWWIFVFSGAWLVLLTAISEVLSFKSHEKEEKQHSHEHAAIATGTTAIYERLAAMTQTTEQPDVKVVEAATSKIETLAAQVTQHVAEL